MNRTTKDVRMRKSKPLRKPQHEANALSTVGVIRDNALPFGLCSIALLLTIVTASMASAGKEVLSDMDCVVEPSAVVRLGSAVPGLIAATSYDKSDFVSRGTIMAKLESRVEEAALAISEELAAHGTGVELRQTTASFGSRTRERNASLVQTSSISKQNMDQVETESRIAQLQVRQERENLRLAQLRAERDRAALERRMIISPIEGTVTKRFKTAGEYVDNDPVYEIAQLNPLHVEVIVPLEYLGRIESGMRGGVTLLAPGFDDQVLEAHVRRIDSVADAASATYGVRLVLDNPEMKVPSGVRCQVDFFSS